MATSAQQLKAKGFLDSEPTAAERLAARLVRRSLYSLRFGSHEAQEAVAHFNRRIAPDLLRRVRDTLESEEAGGRPPSASTAARMEALGRTLRTVIEGESAGQRAALGRTLGRYAESEADFLLGGMRDTLPPALEVSLTAPSPAILRAITEGTTFHGDTLRGWYGVSDERVVREVTRELNIGLASGDPVDTIVRRIRGTAANDFDDGILGGARHELEALVRSSVSHVGQQARMATYRENADIITGYEWVATLDTRTCLTCGPLDGKVFPVEDGRSAREPPEHFNCRCVTVPVLASGRDLGGRLPPAQRASMTGLAPASLKFPEWLLSQPAAVQDDVLGPARGRLFRAGDLDLGDFTDDRGRLLTLDELDELI